MLNSLENFWCNIYIFASMSCYKIYYIRIKPEIDWNVHLFCIWDKCFDSPGWSTDGEDNHFNCKSYDDEMCADLGNKVKRFGCTPNQACCACGGGNGKSKRFVF